MAYREEWRRRGEGRKALGGKRERAWYIRQLAVIAALLVLIVLARRLLEQTGQQEEARAGTPQELVILGTADNVEELEGAQVLTGQGVLEAEEEILPEAARLRMQKVTAGVQDGKICWLKEQEDNGAALENVYVLEA